MYFLIYCWFPFGVFTDFVFIYLGSHSYAKVVVFSKAPLPNYRFDLDDKRPQREVLSPASIYKVLLSSV